jgi:hypothetical protein
VISFSVVCARMLTLCRLGNLKGPWQHDDP